MNKTIVLFTFMLLFAFGEAQSQNAARDSVDNSYFITHSRAEYMQKLADLPCGIKLDDPIPVILDKLQKYLDNFKPRPGYPDDIYALASNLQALKSVKEGGYGIGAVLIDKDGKIIWQAHNSQIQKHRSDLHGEMTLMTGFENSRKSKAYMNMYVCKPGLTVFSSAEPCPMCFIRLATAGVDTRYCTPGPEDGMVTRVNCLPPSWREMAGKHSFKKGNCSPEMQKISHLLFFSFLLDNRGPK